MNSPEVRPVTVMGRDLIIPDKSLATEFWWQATRCVSHGVSLPIIESVLVNYPDDMKSMYCHCSTLRFYVYAINMESVSDGLVITSFMFTWRVGMSEGSCVEHRTLVLSAYHSLIIQKIASLVDKQQKEEWCGMKSSATSLIIVNQSDKSERALMFRNLFII